MNVERVLFWTHWFFYDFSGIRFIWGKIVPESVEVISAGSYVEPATFTLWTIGIYMTLFGITSTLYKLSLDCAVTRLNALIAQLGTTNKDAFKSIVAQFPLIQGIPIPAKPEVLKPHSVIYSLFSNKSKNAEILDWSQRLLESQKKNLENVNLQCINFVPPIFRGSDSSRQRLGGVELEGAKFSGAHLALADFSGANLREADLSETFLVGADFILANLWGANLSGANLAKVNWSKANLSFANLKGIKTWKSVWYQNTNIFGIKNAPDGFKENALMFGAVEMEDEEEWRNLRSKNVIQ